MFSLKWSDSGPPNQQNAYAEVLSVGEDGKVLPIICMHGGSMWLCRSCADEFLRVSPTTARRATVDEHKAFTAR